MSKRYHPTITCPWIFLIFGLSLAVCTLLILTRKQHIPLLVISIDGFRREYLDRGLTPFLVDFGQGGIVADYLLPVFPSITFPNHYSIATGLYPQAHGIVSNVFYDSLLNDTFIYSNGTINKQSVWWKGEPIWVTHCNLKD